MFAAGVSAFVVFGLLSWPVLRFLLQRWHFAIVVSADGQREEVDSYSARPGSLAYLFGGSLAAVMAITAAMLSASGLGSPTGRWVMAGVSWAGGLAYAALQQWLTRRESQRSMALQ